MAQTAAQSGTTPMSTAAIRQEALTKATGGMFEKIAENVKGELHASSEDYKLLEKLNRVTADTFVEHTNKAKEIGASIQQIQDKSKELKPCLDDIDVLEASVSELCNTAQLLDDYSKRIELKYKELIMARRS